MNIYVSHSREFDYQKELYDVVKRSDLYTHHKFILPHDGDEKPSLTKNDLKSGSIDFVIAEVSFPSTGQGIELAWAEEYGVPIECIYKKGRSYPTSLNTICSNFSEYDDLVLLINKLLK